ncbi:MAG: hypothetical protein JWR90_741, partial [Marmoricola sp.]|nr:hypothetical protein [Marmoricola sp.]
VRGRTSYPTRSPVGFEANPSATTRAVHQARAPRGTPFTVPTHGRRRTTT